MYTITVNDLEKLYKKNEKRYIVDRPVMLSEIFKEGVSREEIAKQLCDR